MQTLGHFGRRPIALAWHGIVFPSLLLNYLGQGALALRDPATRESPFFHMVPNWLLWPLIALATAATVIASQALISGAFSLTMQAVRMGYVPFINIRHTSHEEHGQIYISQINTLLALGCITLVIGFRSSDALASAYGIAVTLTMVATTLLLYFAARRVWQWSIPRAGALCGLMLALEGTFLAANSAKVMQGGWLSLENRRGRLPVNDHMEKGALPSAQELAANALAQRLNRLDDRAWSRVRTPRTVPGTAVFLAGQPKGAPMSLLHNLKHNRVLHERNIVLTITH